MPNRKKILQVLSDRNMSQKQLADALGVTRGCVSLWVSGERQPNEGTLKRICEVLNCKAEDIW
jgi:DNA-binding Xre family transcriptional regulator